MYKQLISILFFLFLLYFILKSINLSHGCVRSIVVVVSMVLN